MRSKKEIAFARALADRGLTFATNVRTLPGTPDIVFQEQRIAVFFHGCFWHGHDCRPEPASFEWQYKIQEVKQKDSRAQDSLIERGYRVIVFYECEVDSDIQAVIERLMTRLAIVQFP